MCCIDLALDPDSAGEHGSCSVQYGAVSPTLLAGFLGIARRTHSPWVAAVVVGHHHYHPDWYQPPYEYESSAKLHQ